MALTPGTPVSGELNPANETDLYRFTAAAGDRFYFDVQARTNGGNSLWRLIDPYGNVLFTTSFANTLADVEGADGRPSRGSTRCCWRGPSAIRSPAATPSTCSRRRSARRR